MTRTAGIRESERRPLRVFAFDPMVDRYRPPIVLRVPFEHTEPGPRGRLISVVDIDPETGKQLPKLDLEQREVLLESGLAPSENDYRSHQQCVYAISMVVLEAFERGLGRPILWHAGRPLRLLPHGGDMANGYFEPTPFALYFGTFTAADPNPGDNLAGQTVYTCLAWDVVAHETSHPVMVDLRPFEIGPDEPLPSLPETLALHEGLCDLFALLVRLSERNAITSIVAEHGLDLEKTPLLALAAQFGQAAGIGQELRRFPAPARSADSEVPDEPHLLGQQVTSAVIEAYLGTARDQCRDLFGLHGPPRIDGWLHPDLVGRLCATLSKLARDTLTTCIGALDLLPPFDACFGDFLRAAVTTSVERFGPRHNRLRAHLIEAFRARGFAPSDVSSLALDALRLDSMAPGVPDPLPHCESALLLTQHALDARRAYMADPDLIAGAQETVRKDLAELERFHRDIESFAHDHAARLHLDEKRPIVAKNLTGSYSVDPSGGIRARTTVQLAQPEGNRTPRRGVVVVADSTGEIQFVVKTRAQRQRPESSWPWRRARHDLDLSFGPELDV
jgi:hypothetical protein